MALRWVDSMSVGVAEFDRDHQHKLLLMEQIAAAVAEGGQERAYALVDSLLAFAKDHTTREEAFLRRIGFPALEELLAAQQQALSPIARLKDAAPEEQPKMVATIEDALVAYLLRADINYKSFVEAAGFSDTRGRRP